MKPDQSKIDKLPAWAKKYIGEIELKVTHLEGLPETLPMVERDLPPPDSYGKLSRGWDYNIYQLTSSMGGYPVSKGCSSTVHHGHGWDKTSSQGPRSLYSTERKAWLALKSEFIKWASEKLAYVDSSIKKASNEPAQ